MVLTICYILEGKGLGKQQNYLKKIGALRQIMVEDSSSLQGRRVGGALNDFMRMCM